jgi:rubrerythrin
VPDEPTQTPPSRGNEPEYKPARHWSKDKRFREAAKKVVHDEWTQGRAAKWYGVSRQRLNGRVKEYREEVERQRLGALSAELSGTVLDAAVRPLALQETRRVGTFEEFDARYFGQWICPDCGVHHEVPDFHDRMLDRS